MTKQQTKPHATMSMQKIWTPITDLRIVRSTKIWTATPKYKQINTSSCLSTQKHSCKLVTQSRTTCLSTTTYPFQVPHASAIHSMWAIRTRLLNRYMPQYMMYKALRNPPTERFSGETTTGRFPPTFPITKAATATTVERALIGAASTKTVIVTPYHISAARKTENNYGRGGCRPNRFNALRANALGAIQFHAEQCIELHPVQVRS